MGEDRRQGHVDWIPRDKKGGGTPGKRASANLCVWEPLAVRFGPCTGDMAGRSRLERTWNVVFGRTRLCVEAMRYHRMV